MLNFKNSIMKRSLLFLAISILGIAAFAQTSITEVQFNDGNTYSYTSPFTVEGGASILVPVADFTNGTVYYDLSSYDGIEFQFTCTSNDLNNTFPLRLVVVNPADESALSVVKDVTFTTETQTVSFNFADAEFNGSKKLWGIKINWGAGAFTDQVTVNYINVTTGTTSLAKTSINKDPNRLVDVYSISGTLIRKNVKYSEAVNELTNGLYIIGNKKVCISNK